MLNKDFVFKELREKIECKVYRVRMMGNKSNYCISEYTSYCYFMCTNKKKLERDKFKIFTPEVLNDCFYDYLKDKHIPQQKRVARVHFSNAMYDYLEVRVKIKIEERLDMIQEATFIQGLKRSAPIDKEKK